MSKKKKKKKKIMKMIDITMEINDQQDNVRKSKLID
jgi:hypothetical protein